MAKKRKELVLDSNLIKSIVDVEKLGKGMNYIMEWIGVILCKKVESFTEPPESLGSKTKRHQSQKLDRNLYSEQGKDFAGQGRWT